MADQVIFSESMRTESMEQPFLKKEVVYVQDNNSGGVYNGQIVIETSQLSNSGKWASYGEGYLYIPYVVAFRSTADLNGRTSVYGLGMKSGWWQILHSMSVDYNSSNVVQLTPYLNIWCSYQALTTWSISDYAKYSSVTNFFKDNAESISYYVTANANLDGTGICNNKVTNTVLPTLVNTANAGQNVILQNQANFGYAARLFNTNTYPALAGAQDINEVASLISSDNSQAAGLSYFGLAGAADATRTWFLYCNAVIRLKDISDFFDKLPLVKGAYIKLTINYNAGTTAVAFTTATNRLAINAAPVLTAGATIPYMFSSAAASNPNNAWGADTTFNIASNVSQVTPSGGATVSHYIRSCRLYVPLYTMNPIYEEQYVSMNPTKEVVYRDIYQYTVSSVANGNSFNNLLTNGIVSPKQLVIVPFLSAGAGNFCQTTTGLNSLNSCFSSGPATSDPFINITNFNVQLSGINVFQQNVSYGYEEFLNELSKINSVNGGQTTGLTSGSISLHEYEKAFRFLCVDLSRGYKADDFIPKSVLISGTNSCQKIVDLYCFIQYERKITINVSSGQIVQV